MITLHQSIIIGVIVPILVIMFAGRQRKDDPTGIVLLIQIMVIALFLTIWGGIFCW